MSNEERNVPLLSGVLGYHPNPKYNPNTIGSWFGEGEGGTLSARDGALILKAGKPGFTVRTRFFPMSGDNGRMVFEARAHGGASLSIAGVKGPLAVGPDRFDRCGDRVAQGHRDTCGRYPT